MGSMAMNGRPVVLALVENSVGSLASLLLAAEVAVTRDARLVVVSIVAPRLLLAGPTGIPIPAQLWAECDRHATSVLRDRAACLLALTDAEWTFTVSTGRSVRRTLIGLVAAYSPVAVVLGTPRRRGLPCHRRVGRWLKDWPEVRMMVTRA
jgi:hypothetical protein